MICTFENVLIWCFQFRWNRSVRRRFHNIDFRLNAGSQQFKDLMIQMKIEYYTGRLLWLNGFYAAYAPLSTQQRIKCKKDCFGAAHLAMTSPTGRRKGFFVARLRRPQKTPSIKRIPVIAKVRRRST